MPPAHPKELGRLVRARREAKDLSLRQLAELSGVQHIVIYRLENAQRQTLRPEVLEKLAPHLGVRLADLYTLAGIALPQGLPDLAPYLRAKYDLPADAVDEMEQFIESLRERYGSSRRRKGASDGKRRRSTS